MDKLLFGDNQFFGVNHMSEEKARAQAIRFQSVEAIIETLDAAYVEGIKTFMCTTHERIGLVVEHMRADSARYADFKFFPGMPYAHKYANAMTEDGFVGAIKRVLPEEGVFSAAFRGGVSFARKDIEGLTILLVDAEMKMFKGVSTPVIFLQNVVTDLLMGLKFHACFRMFADHVRKRYDAEPGFITMNLPRLVRVLEDLGVHDPIVCSSINRAGFRMCGGLAAYEETLKNHKFRAIAMSVFASGALHPREAIEWVCQMPNIEAIVFGASSQSNIHNTRELVDTYWKGTSASTRHLPHTT